MRVHFGEQDDTQVDVATSVPEETVKTLLCRTEEAVRMMNQAVVDMAAAVADMSDLLSTQMPALRQALEETKEAIETNTRDGVEQSELFLTAMNEVADAAREVRDGLRTRSAGEGSEES